MSEPLVFHASPSKITLFLDCPRRYKYRYIDNLPTLPRPWFSFGASVHMALKELFDLEPGDRTWEVLEGSLRRNWIREGYATKDEEKSYGERALRGLKTFFEKDREVQTIATPRLSEFTIQLKFDDVVLNGKVDRVDQTEAGFVVTDYKTGEPRAPEWAATDLAFTIYALLVRGRLHAAPAKLVWNFVENATRVETNREPDALDRALADVLGIVADIRAEKEFEPRPGHGCRFCDYLGHCEDGAAFVRQASEEAKEAEEG
ncbi:MAG: PD-(D/E)XK nuclease family protein [Actinobacteria bacterium]|nr:PD-(D/E)XK nuclease family protein [Actinomycetota bacterium]